MKTSKTNAFTLIELLVVISIIAILAGIALPVFSTVMVRGQQTKALSNAKQIGLALKLYAMDNGDLFPSYALNPTTLKPDTNNAFNASTPSNYALAQLFPDYLQNEVIFFTPGSKFTLVQGDNHIDNPQIYPPQYTLAAGENTWAYVTGLTDTSNALFPLLADGFNDNTQHTYVADKTQKGGVWEGKKAIVLRVDCSATCDKTSPATGGGTARIMGGNPVDGGDLFSTTAATATQTWLGTSNYALNPQ